MSGWLLPSHARVPYAISTLGLTLGSVQLGFCLGIRPNLKSIVAVFQNPCSGVLRWQRSLQCSLHEESQAVKVDQRESSLVPFLTPFG
ncbi:hypothetical protein F5Y09DRAFT_305736 [Xylaria sp. FL1042]|nr:hypothetical protein F5Y09DRAFT_305736 [Xylaria sp. FL1042]